MTYRSCKELVVSISSDLNDFTNHFLRFAVLETAKTSQFGLYIGTDCVLVCSRQVRPLLSERGPRDKLHVDVDFASFPLLLEDSPCVNLRHGNCIVEEVANGPKRNRLRYT